MRPERKAQINARATFALAFALAAMLAGCAEETEPAAGDEAPREPAVTPTIELEASPQTEVGEAPHVHDYWLGRECVTLVDTDITVEPPTALMWGAQSTRFLGETAFGGAFVTLPEGAIVYEGSGRLEITVTWTESSITGLRFLHRHAGSGEIQPWTETPNGKTVLLDVTPGMTDMPHAKTSRWAFLMAASGTPAVAIGTFHVQMDIVKMRDVAEWPAHPDLWAGESQITIADAEGHIESRVAPLEIAETDPWAVPADAIPAQRLVPMEAATLRVNVTILALDEAIEIDRLYLHARTALDVEFDFDDQGEPADVSEDGMTWSWRRAIEMDETDNPYAAASAWGFRVVAGAGDAPLPECDNGCYEAELSYHIAVVVEKAAPEA